MPEPTPANGAKIAGETAGDVEREPRASQTVSEPAARARARRQVKPPDGESTKHGVFHLLAVLLAFIMGSLFAVHTENQKDLRTQLAVLYAIKWELGRAQARLTDLSRRTRAPCAVPWNVELIDTRVWQEVATKDSVLLLQDVRVPPRSAGDAGNGQAAAGGTLLDELRSTYDELALAPTKTVAIGSEMDCAKQMGDWVAQVSQTGDDLNAVIGDVSGQYRRGQVVLSQPLWLTITAIFGVLWLWTLFRGRLVRR